MVTTDGFVRLPNWLIDDSDLTLNELAVYIVLLRFRDHKTGKCHPGMTTIADRARMSRKSVERAIPKLEARQMIRVERRSTLTENKPNVYTVALAGETPKFVWEKSARGRRVPKHPRTPTDTESVGVEVEGLTTDTESVPTDRESRPPQTESRPNKNQKNKNQGQAVTPASGSNHFTFESSGDDGATEQQVAYLKDLAIHLGYETGGGVPNDLQIQRWRKLNREEADTQIRGYLKALGKPDEILYPQAGDPAFQALSTKGKHFAQSAGDPASVTNAI